jgi:hypothetical protein
LCGDFRHGLRGVNEANFRSYNFLYEGFDEGIMCASQDQGIDVFRKNRPEVFLGGKTGNRVVQPPFFNQRDKKRTGLGKNSDAGIVFMDGTGIRIAVDCCRRTNDADNFLSRFGNSYAGACIYYVEHGNRRKSLDSLVRDSGHGVAGNDEQFHILFQ